MLLLDFFFLKCPGYDEEAHLIFRNDLITLLNEIRQLTCDMRNVAPKQRTNLLFKIVSLQINIEMMLEKDDFYKSDVEEAIYVLSEIKTMCCTSILKHIL